jgi:hypothetical protein
MAALAGTTVPALVDAHAVMAGTPDPGLGMWWFYGLLLGGLGGTLLYRKWRGGKEPPERKALKRRLAELERVLKSNLMQLQNADDYPKECGLTDEQRRDRQISMTKIRRLIYHAKSELASL